MNKIFKNTKNILFIACFFTLMLLCSSCFLKKPKELVLSDRKIMLTKEPTIIQSPKIFTAERNSNSIRLSLTKKWDWSDYHSDKGEIKFEDGNVANIQVILIDNHGIRYSAGNYGRGGGFLIAYYVFPEDVKIVKVEITSSLDIYCEKVVWYCYDPI